MYKTRKLSPLYSAYFIKYHIFYYGEYGATKPFRNLKHQDVKIKMEETMSTVQPFMA